MIGILDGNAFAIGTAMSILSGTMPVIMPTEIDEIKRRMAMRLFTAHLQHGWDRMYIALDRRPYWRTGWMEKNCKDIEGNPVVYKGNRDGKESEWPLQTPKVEVVKLAHKFFHDCARLVNARIVIEEGLEADDIASFIATSVTDDVLLLTTDGDWRQLISPRVKLYDLRVNEYITETYDIRLKWIAGDRGDNIPGCKKSARTRWGTPGAKKFLEEHGDSWESKVVDQEQLAHNKVLATLPATHFDVPAAMDYLAENCVHEGASDTTWDEYFLTPILRERLGDAAEREAFIQQLRARLQENMAEKWGI